MTMAAADMTPGAEKSTAVISGQRWELLLAFRERSDSAANALRALLYAAAGGEFAFSVTNIEKAAAREIWIHVAVAILCGFALLILTGSWLVQKRKADRRYEWLLFEGSSDAWIDEFRKFEDELRDKWWKKNQLLDVLAFFAVAAGALAELLAKLVGRGLI